MIQGVVDLRRLNSGGNGDLYLGRAAQGGARVVVKCLRDWHLPHCMKAFGREIGVLARRLPGFVRILWWDTAARPPYYVMEFVEGGALTIYAGALTGDQLHGVACALASALANLHSASLTHGDVKPDNILVTKEGHLQVADPLGNGTLFTMLFSQNCGGTPGYCAPEIRAGGSISHAGDVYSLGATMYHLLTGRRPQDGQVLDPSSEGYTQAPKIREVVAACCDPDPRARPTTHEVLRLLAGERWSAIQAQKKQTQSFLGAACLVGLGFLAVAALAHGQKG